MVVVAVVVACLIAAAAIAFVVARRPSELVRVTAPPRGAEPARPYSKPLSATGEVEILPVRAVAASGPAVRSPAAVSPLFDIDLEPEMPLPPAPEVRWSSRFDPRSGALDDIARLRLIGDLGVVAKEWCVPLLCQAYEEEQRPANRQAALIALAACRSRTAVTTYRLALASGEPAERAIASDALADLEPPAQTKPRTAVERH